MSITFIDDQHREFYEARKNLRTASEYRGLVYLLGISPETRAHYTDLYRDRAIRPEGLYESWQTGTTSALTRLAFCTYTGHPVYDYSLEGTEAENAIATYCTADIFGVLGTYLPYALQGVQIAYGGR